MSMKNDKGIPATYHRQTTQAGIADLNQTNYSLSSNRDKPIVSITRTQYDHLPPYEHCIATVSAEYGYLLIIDDDNLCETCAASDCCSKSEEEPKNIETVCGDYEWQQ